MTVPVLWISRHADILARGYYDEGLLEAILAREVWDPPGGLTFEHHEVRGDFPAVPGALVVLPARHHGHGHDVVWLKAQLDRLAWAVVILAGSEDWDAFPWREITETPTRRVWTMQPIPQHAHLSGLIPGGWYPGTREGIRNGRNAESPKPLDWFFAGQVTNERRDACARVLRDLPGGRLLETDGYLKGMPRDEYFAILATAKIVPCPSGPCSVDTARTFEALEAGCVPVSDLRKPRDPQFDYWQLLMGADQPTPTIADWATFPDRLAELLADWPTTANRVWSFWQQYKRRLVHHLDDDLRAVMQAAVVGGIEAPLGVDRVALRAEWDALHAVTPTPDELVTVIITTSPTPGHSSTADIEIVVASVREQLPRAEIVIVADGVRPEQDDRHADYGEYLRRLLWLTNVEWRNVVPVVLDEWGHQANATRRALDFVRTPLILFVEHDTPLMGEIDWVGLCAFVRSGEANAIRLHFDVEIHPDHEEVMLDHETHWIEAGERRNAPVGLFQDGLPLRRTVAWWQRPHLASTQFYRDRILPLFPETSRGMIEDKVYGVMWSAYADHGEPAWWDWRVWIYTPDTPIEQGGMKRSGHLDSRGDAEKYEMVYE